MTATFRQWAEALQTVTQDWSESDRKKLFHDNAHRFYELPAL
jgi:predicted TIM-barrel fold metal-dependent hydrolase